MKFNNFKNSHFPDCFQHPDTRKIAYLFLARKCSSDSQTSQIGNNRRRRKSFSQKKKQHRISSQNLKISKITKFHKLQI